MPMIVVGMNHRTAPVEMREQFSLQGCGLPMALQELKKVMVETTPDTNAAIREGLILSTCNRFEIYAIAKERKLGWKVLREYMTRLQGLPVEEIRPHVYEMEGPEALEHLMKVAAGVDSMVLGEPQILGQVGEAMADARNAGTFGLLLAEIAKRVLHTGKRARTETAIGRFTTSVSHAAVDLAKSKLGDLSKMSVVVVGAGEMAALAGRALRDNGAGSLAVINRTYARSVELADSVGGKALNWYHLPDALVEADVMITATDAPHPVIYAKDVAPLLSKRGGRPLLFLDIALPRDVEPAVNDLENVEVADIDALNVVVKMGAEQRAAAIPQIEAIIAEEIQSYYDWLKTRDVVPVIVELRRTVQELVEQEMAEALRKVALPEDAEVIKRLGHRVTNKILHSPTTCLKAHAANGNGVVFADAIRQLFDLDESGKKE